MQNEGAFNRDEINKLIEFLDMSIGDVEDIFLPLNLLKYKKEEKPWVGYFTNAIIEITIAITERIMCMSLNLNIERLFCLSAIKASRYDFPFGNNVHFLISSGVSLQCRPQA